ncbi:hypothetical protein BgiMline_014038 [Biomphalaria glabrata]|nr:hypothetical protein BgiMline_012832 [Biomphalaria glabrata]
MSQAHLEEWSTTECIYNERINKIHNRTLLYLKGALLQEIEGNTDTEENIFTLNFLTWLEYKLNNFFAAKTRTDEVLRLTNSTNLTALIGKVKILYKLRENDDLEATKKTLLSERLAEDAKIDSRAQLAYCYCRLGGADFLKRSIGIFEDLLKKQPSNDYWNLSLGIAHFNAWTT